MVIAALKQDSDILLSLTLLVSSSSPVHTACHGD